MNKLLLISTDKESLSTLASALVERDDVELSWASSGGDALGIISSTAIDLVVVDERLGDMTGLEFVRRLLSVNPMIHCTAVSSLSPEEFHEASEGLGLLAQLPISPGRAQAEDLLQRLKKVQDLTDGMKI